MRKFNGTPDEIGQTANDLIDIADAILETQSGDAHDIANELRELGEQVDDLATQLEHLNN